MSKRPDKERALRERLAFAVRLDEVGGIRGGPTSSNNRIRADERVEQWEHEFRLPKGSLLAGWSVALGLNKREITRVLNTERHLGRAVWGRIAMEAVRRAEETGFEDADTEAGRFVLCAAAWPWLRWARRELERIVRQRFTTDARGFAPDDAVKLFYSALLTECQDIMLRTIALEVNVARVRGELPSGSGTERFTYFCRNLGMLDKALAFWCEYPVLARFVIETCIRWVERSVEMLERLDRDWGSLIAKGLVDTTSKTLLEEVVTLGDPHCGDRRVSVMQFNTGSRLVYKTRSVRAEEAFRSWLQWMNRHGLELPMEAPRLCDCNEYGWAEFVDYAGSSDEPTRSEFYFRCGVVLALADALGIRDLSQDNIIARGAVPYFVDVECVLSPTVRDAISESSWAESLLGVGLLPGLESRQGIDQSGLVPSGGETLQGPLPTITDWRTDRMRIQLLPVKLPETTRNTPGKIGADDLSQYAEHVVRGFTHGYDLISANGRSLVESVRGLARTGIHIRYIPRTTVAYAAIRDGLTHPNIVRDAYDGEALIAKLAINSNRTLIPLLPSERKQLWHLDIPMFWTKPDSTDLWTAEGHRIAKVFSLSGKLRTQSKIRDGSNQQYLSHCVGAVRAALAQSRPADVFVNFPRSTGDHRADCLSLAHAIGQHLLLKAWKGDHGTLEWIDRAENVSGQVATGATVRPLGEDLYSGLAGMLMFYAYLSVLTSEPAFREVTDGLTAQIEGAVRKRCRRALAGRWGDRIRHAGGFIGITSAMYALLHVSHLRGNSLAKTTRLLIDALSRWAVQDSALDWIGGAAGEIAILLAIEGVTPKLGALDIAKTCWWRLLGSARKVGGGYGWATIDKEPLTGLGHGASGIALAAHRLRTVTREETSLAIFDGALQFECEHYNSAIGNWLDLRSWIPNGRTTGAYGWCAGAAGIGLARLGMSDQLRETRSEEIDVAFRATESHARELETDGLCHGRFGNIEFLFATAWQFGNPHHNEAAISCFEDVLKTCRRDGFQFSCGGETLNFMLGLAGIGYALLRIATRGSVPSVLLLDPPGIKEFATEVVAVP